MLFSGTLYLVIPRAFFHEPKKRPDSCLGLDDRPKVIVALFLGSERRLLHTDDSALVLTCHRPAITPDTGQCRGKCSKERGRSNPIAEAPPHVTVTGTYLDETPCFWMRPAMSAAIFAAVWVMFLSKSRPESTNFASAMPYRAIRGREISGSSKTSSKGR